MKSYTVDSLADLISPNRTTEPIAMPSMIPDSAIVFHYHIHEDVLDSHSCIWRVVFSTEHFSDVKDVIELWNEVVQEFLLDDMYHTILIDFIPLEVTTCTNCGELDTSLKLLPCYLCSSPLCMECYEKQGYCNGHLN